VHLPIEIKEEIRDLFSKPGEQLSDRDVQEIADNLLGFALRIDQRIG